MALLKENITTKNAIANTKRASGKSELWEEVRRVISLPTRKRIEINLSRLDRVTKANDTVVVPGKVLGAGVMTHKLSIAALSFSSVAKKSIEKAGGKCTTIDVLAAQNPKGTGIIFIE